MFDPRLKSDIKRSQSFSLRFRESFHQYLLSTTLHGLKYVGDRTITRLERWVLRWFQFNWWNSNQWNSFRFFFAFMFLVVLILSGFFITNVWNRWNTSPIIVVLDAQGFSIRDVPFPGIIQQCKHFGRTNDEWFHLTAVTICNMNQAQKSAVSKIPHSSEEFSALQSICRYQKKEKHQDIGDGKWETFRKVLLDVRFTWFEAWKPKLHSKFLNFVFSLESGGSTLQTYASCMQIWRRRSWLQLYFRYYFDW